MPPGARVHVRWLRLGDMTSTEASTGARRRRTASSCPGGFGARGIEGKIAAAAYAREQRHSVPRHLPRPAVRGDRVRAQHVRARGRELDGVRPETPHPVIDLLPEQTGIEDMGGTMRLGHYRCRARRRHAARGPTARTTIHERHRHRYEVNNQFRNSSSRGGLVVSGTSQEGRLVEIVELPDHPWFVASQFHPEFKSRPTRPAPLFRGFVGAGLERARARSGLAVEAAR